MDDSSKAPRVAGRSSRIIPLILLATVLILYSPFLFGGRYFAPQDFLNFIYPWKGVSQGTVNNLELFDVTTAFVPNEVYMNKWLKQGEYPLWNTTIFSGYPIGSVLLWDAPSSSMQSDTRSGVLPPSDPQEARALFVLDGQQRILSLYGCLRSAAAESNPLFQVAFSLTSKTFVHLDEVDPDSPEPRVPLRSLFDPHRFLDEQSKLARAGHRDLLNLTVDLHARFQEYAIPVVTIEGREVPEVVEIFARVNRMGTRLSTFDFMRATTWSGSFDLAKAVNGTLREVEEQSGFSLKDETVAKLMAVALNEDPISKKMIGLRGTAPEKLERAIQRSTQALLRTSKFLRDRLGILSADYVPYEGQFLVCAAAFLRKRLPTATETAHLEQWFWRVGLTEGLTGKSEFQISRMVGLA